MTSLSTRFITSSRGEVTNGVSDDRHCSPWIGSTHACRTWSEIGVAWACAQVRERMGETKAWMIVEVVDGDGKR